MITTTYTETRLFDVLEPEWNELTQRSIANNVFSMWEWASVWWQAYEPGDLWVTTFRTEDERLVGIAPWFVETHPEFGRVVRTIGAEDVTDYLDLIVDRDCIEAVFEAMINFLVENADQYGAIRLANIPEVSPTYQTLPDQMRAAGFTVDWVLNDVCPLIELPKTFDDYLKNILDSKESREVRRKLRRTRGDLYDIDWYIVDERHDLDNEIDQFLTLLGSADPEKAAFLENEAHVRFFKSITPLLYEAGWLQLTFLTVDGEPAAAYFNIDYDNRILVYNSGLEPGKFGALSPGIVLLAWNIEHAIEQGRSVFDFLRGNEEYKYKMGGKDTHVYELQAVLAEE